MPKQKSFNLSLSVKKTLQSLPCATALWQRRCSYLVLHRQQQLRLLLLQGFRQPAPNAATRCYSSSGGGGGSEIGRLARRLRNQPKQQQQPQQQQGKQSEQQNPGQQPWIAYSVPEDASGLDRQKQLLSPAESVLLFEAQPYRLYVFSFAMGAIALLCVYNLYDFFSASWTISRQDEASLRQRLLSDIDEESNEESEAGGLANWLPSSSFGSWFSVLTCGLYFLVAGLSGFCAFVHSMRLASRLVLEPGGRHLLVTTLAGTRRIGVDQLRVTASAKRPWIEMAQVYNNHLLLSAPPGPPIRFTSTLLAVAMDSRFVKEPTVLAALVKRFRQ